VTNVSLDNIKHASVNLTDAPAANPGARQDSRMMTITAAFHSGAVQDRRIGRYLADLAFLARAL
jgi:hypothetical protein